MMLNKTPASSMVPFPPTMIIISVIISTFPTFIHSQNVNDTSYEDCSPFRCGNLTFSFPFSSSLTSGYCGLPDYQITCDPSSIPKLLLSGKLYQVKDFYSSQNDRLITVVDTQLIQDLTSGSCESLHNLSIANNSIGPLTLPSGSLNFTFFNCPSGLSIFQEFANKVIRKVSCNNGHALYLSRAETQFDNPSFDPVLAPSGSGCQSVMVPVSSLFRNTSVGGVFQALNQGFPLEWPQLYECDRCRNRSGRCGYDRSLKKIVCFCKGGACDSVKHRKSKLPHIIGAAAGSSSVVFIAVLLVVFRKKISAFFKKSHSEEHQNIGDGLNVKQFIKTFRSTLLSNYSYNDVKKMTNGFKEKLGAGGYGNVYSGKFLDGRLVAVKMLEKTSSFSDNFINEVATIGRIHHVNIISLLGFCCDGSTRALIYEYMPNGSLGDLLSKDKENNSLKLAKLLEIALGVAHAIEYLHNGCEMRILHLDIKPQNVLLDQDFNPKVSDFGLAKAHSRNASVVTMTAGPRGTIGYIAPEIFLRNFGNPSHKSDVYSYGMLLIEMVGGKKHLEPTETTSSSSTTEAYFPDWIYDKLIQEKEDFVEGEEDCIARKMIMVSLWCIQINPIDRPSMTRVVEMLSASVESIKMPPKPLFLSPPSLQIENEIISFDSNISDLPLQQDSHEMYYST